MFACKRQQLSVNSSDVNAARGMSDSLEGSEQVCNMHGQTARWKPRHSNSKLSTPSLAQQYFLLSGCKLQIDVCLLSVQTKSLLGYLHP